MSRARKAYGTVILSVALTIFAEGCGSTTVDPLATRPGPQTSSLTAFEVARYSNALEAIRTLRGQWLTSRSKPRRSPGVFIDGTLTSGIQTLAQYPADRIREIRFLPGSEASTRFGSEFGAGVILISTER